ncbi:unnamed protein product, partial [Ectocarpus sp. 8 AP-2014]
MVGVTFKFSDIYMRVVIFIFEYNQRRSRLYCMQEGRQYISSNSSSYQGLSHQRSPYILPPMTARLQSERHLGHHGHQNSLSLLHNATGTTQAPPYVHRLLH